MSQSSKSDVGLAKGAKKELHEISEEIALACPIRTASDVRPDDNTASNYYATDFANSATMHMVVSCT